MTVFGSTDFSDTAYVGVVYRKKLEVYLNATTDPCAPPTVGASVDLTRYPTIVFKAKTPNGTELLGTGIYLRQTAPAYIQLTLLDTILDRAVEEGATAVTLSCKVTDNMGNEETIIGNGHLSLEHTAL